MLKIKKFFTDKGPVAVVLSVVLSVLFVVGVVEAATTISANINTAGTLTVSSTSTLTGAVTATAGITSGANIVSDSDSVDSLGLTGTRWASTFSDNFTGNTITLDGATGVNVLTIKDNVADGLSVVHDGTDFLVFVTTNSSEQLTITPDTSITGDLIVDTNTLFVDVSANKVGFGTTSPTALLTVGSTTPTHLTAGNQYFSAYINGELEVDDASWFDGAVTLASTLGVTGISTLTDDLVVDTNTLFVDVSANKVGFGIASPTALLTVGSTTPTHLTAGNQYFSAYINGELETGGAAWFDGAVTLASTLDVTGNVSFDGGTFIFNDAGADKDFRIEGDTEESLFVADASADKIGIGTSTPLNLAHIEDASATSTLTISSGSASSGGRIIFEDTDGAGCTELSFLDGAIIHEAITCPAGI